MRYIFFTFGLIALIACNGCRETGNKQQLDYAQIEEDLIQANRNKVKEEREEIDDFISDKGWPMTESPTGLRYWIYEQGDSVLAQKGMTATLNYDVSLLDGTHCYSSEESGTMDFVVGQDYVESGIHEGILHLGQGGKAKFILPSHLAFGFTGDADKIPQNASVVYDVQLLDLR